MSLVQANSALLEIQKRRRQAFLLDRNGASEGRQIRLRVHYSGLLAEHPDAVLSVFVSDRDAILELLLADRDFFRANARWIEGFGFAVAEPPEDIEISRAVMSIRLETAEELVRVAERELRRLRFFDDPCVATHPPSYMIEDTSACAVLSHLDREGHPLLWLAEILYAAQAYVKDPSSEQLLSFEKMLAQAGRVGSAGVE